MQRQSIPSISSKKKKAISLPKLLKKAQTVFNNWIRERDKDLGCISCGNPVEHAGHYLSQGHNGSMRFNELNVNGQCNRCNTFLHGNLINYRKGLLKKYGWQKVEMLENQQHQVKKWSRAELEAIIQEYKNKKPEIHLNSNKYVTHPYNPYDNSMPFK